jgi:hypothetical protein
MLAKTFENYAEVLHVFLPRFRKDVHVVQVNHHEVEFFGDSGHETLECSRRVAQAKGHDRKLVKSAVGDKGRLVLIGRIHPNLPIARLEVDAGEVS